MGKILKPEDLERFKKDVDGPSNEAARRVAREKLDERFPLREGQAEAVLPNGTRARMRPHATDPYDIDVDATKKGGDPVDMRKATGRKPNDDGSVRIDPRHVIDTLGELGGVDLNPPLPAPGSGRGSGGTPIFSERTDILRGGGKHIT